MQLRFAEDRRTLFYAFVLFPLVPALIYWKPSLLAWLAPVLLYLSYCSGVLSHNHNHCPVFAGRKSNLTYGAWLSFFYGFPSFAWIPTHNQNHHRYVNGEGDATRTTKLGAHDTLARALTYPLASSRWQLPLILGYVRGAARNPARLRRITLECAALVLGHAALFALAVNWHGAFAGSLVYFGALGLPALLAPYFMMFTNYLQHAGADPASPDDHSRNFTAPFWNWFVFDNGLHTVHHDNPGVHWSRCRALHEARAVRVDPSLNESTLFAYVFRRYFWPRREPKLART